jgi:guanylate kinase
VKPFLTILSAPSGTGKSTICHQLMKKRVDVFQSISSTTRLPRPGEKSGKDYYFLTVDEFKAKIQAQEFIEWATVHGEYYGTSRQVIEDLLGKGVYPLLAIDVQGAASIKNKMTDAVLIFLAPPSMESLKIRLEKRKDAKDDMMKRLADSRDEISAAKNYDYIVVNDDLEKAVSQIDSIITAEKLKVSRQELSKILPTYI